jgi:hypothetical protein
MTNEFWEYNLTSDSWTSLTNYIGGAKNYLSGFVINNSVYAGFGSPGYGVTFNEYGYFNQSSSFCSSLSGSLQNGLVGYWPFCGNANDDSGNGFNGTVSGAILTTDRFGNSNSAYSFDGVNDQIDVSGSNFGTSAFTISGWFEMNTTQTQNSLNWKQIFMGGYSNSNKTFEIQTFKENTNFKLLGNIRQITAFDKTVTSVNYVNTSNWIHFVFVNNLSSIVLYLNGVPVATNTHDLTDVMDNNNYVFGNGQGNCSNRWWEGKIDDIGIWNRALTTNEISSLYNQNQCINTITATDTLIINVGQLSYTAPVTFANNITIYPNPANTQVNISFNNIADLAGGTIKIINSLGQQVATTPISLSGTNTTLALNTWGGTGLYFVQIINAQGQIVDIKKIILQ